MAYVGSGVLGSSAGMDKDVMKRLFAQAKLPMVKHVTLLRAEWEKSPRKSIALIEAALKYPVFVKPANLGSSVGISKVHNRKELAPALRLAAKYDRKLVVEQGVGGAKARAREFEVGVLGNDDPQASVVGEIIPARSSTTTRTSICPRARSGHSRPAQPRRNQADSADGRRCLPRLRPFGLARVDFLMDPDGKRRIFLNEVNTMPGFTRISMYPKLWAATGVTIAT